MSDIVERAQARAEENEVLERVGGQLDQASGSTLRVLLVIAARLGRIEDALNEVGDIVDQRIPGDL